MAKIDVAATITETADLLNKKDDLLQEISDNRFLLRAAARSGQANAEQTEWIKETFPEQKNKTPEERIAAKREEIAALEAKANGGTTSKKASRAAA